MLYLLQRSRAESNRLTLHQVSRVVHRKSPTHVTSKNNNSSNIWEKKAYIVYQFVVNTHPEGSQLDHLARLEYPL